MFRLALVLFLVCKTAFVTAQANSEFCQVLLANATRCLQEQSIFNVDEYLAIDDNDCTTCLRNSTFIPQSEEDFSCETAVDEICSSATLCGDCCFPDSYFCQQEIYDYYVCLHGTKFAPSNCVVQCEGSLPEDADDLSEEDGVDLSEGYAEVYGVNSDSVDTNDEVFVDAEGPSADEPSADNAGVGPDEPSADNDGFSADEPSADNDGFSADEPSADSADGDSVDEDSADGDSADEDRVKAESKSSVSSYEQDSASSSVSISAFVVASSILAFITSI